jgi:cell shape-determining protein MreC
VETISLPPGKAFAEITVKPEAKLDSSREVLLVMQPEIEAGSEVTE